MNSETIDFMHNWNNKLNCDCFSTIRLHNPAKYQVGLVKNIRLIKPRLIEYGQAEIMTINTFVLSQLSEPMALLDTALSRKAAQEAIKVMYSGKPMIWDTQKLDFIVLRKKKAEVKQGSMF